MDTVTGYQNEEAEQREGDLVGILVQEEQLIKALHLLRTQIYDIYHKTYYEGDDIKELQCKKYDSDKLDVDTDGLSFFKKYYYLREQAKIELEVIGDLLEQLRNL